MGACRALLDKHRLCYCCFFFCRLLANSCWHESCRPADLRPARQKRTPTEWENKWQKPNTSLSQTDPPLLKITLQYNRRRDRDTYPLTSKSPVLPSFSLVHVFHSSYFANNKPVSNLLQNWWLCFWLEWFMDGDSDTSKCLTISHIFSAWNSSSTVKHY